MRSHSLSPATLTVALILLAGLTVPRAADAQEGGIERGAVPEAVVLQTLDGERFDLGSVIGKRPALVEFWASWCHVCLALHPRVVAAQERYGEQVDFLIVAVGVGQTPARVQQHLARQPMPGMRILWDGGGDAVRAFDAPGTGFIVILDADGRVAYTGTGTDQDLVGAVGRVVGRR
jgi:thiol-disulfide isomerase/thioredoxin